MNALTRAGVYEENLLFATLDSTTRVLKLAPQYRALLTDTVGFIRKLPHGLVASFRSTLAEIREADCIVHIVDIGSPSWREQMAEVDKILLEMDLKDSRRILVFNKVDILTDVEPRRSAERENPQSVFISARSGLGIEALLGKMREAMAAEMIEMEVMVPARDGLLLAELYRIGEILHESTDEVGSTLRVRLPESQARRLGLISNEAENPTG
jgi:GTP-binding protein HflX